MLKFYEWLKILYTDPFYKTAEKLQQFLWIAVEKNEIVQVRFQF